MDEGDADAREKLRVALAPPKRIVFFGDWSGPAKRGAAFCGRKPLVKAIATSGVCVITSEKYTSKMCPCCHGGKLHDVPGTDRVRVCENNEGGTCPVASIDRDIAGALNIARVGVARLAGYARPVELCSSDATPRDITTLLDLET